MSISLPKVICHGFRVAMEREIFETVSPRIEVVSPYCGECVDGQLFGHFNVTWVSSGIMVDRSNALMAGRRGELAQVVSRDGGGHTCNWSSADVFRLLFSRISSKDGFKQPKFVIHLI